MLAGTAISAESMHAMHLQWDAVQLAWNGALQGAAQDAAPLLLSDGGQQAHTRHGVRFCGTNPSRARVQVHASLGRLTAAAAQQSPSSEASKHFSEALRCYGVALAAPAALGDLRERSDVRWEAFPAAAWRRLRVLMGVVPLGIWHTPRSRSCPFSCGHSKQVQASAACWQHGACLPGCVSAEVQVS